MRLALPLRCSHCSLPYRSKLAIGISQNRTTAQLIADLDSGDLPTRMAAFQSLRSTPGALGSSGVPAALARLVQKENAIADSALRGTSNTLTIADAFGDDYPNDTSAIAAECAVRCPLDDSGVALAAAAAATTASSLERSRSMSGRSRASRNFPNAVTAAIRVIVSGPP